MLVIYFNCMSCYVDIIACFFRGDFSANECICDILKDSARAIRGKFTFAGARESCWVIRTMYTVKQSHNYLQFQLNMSKHVREKCGKHCIFSILSPKRGITPTKTDAN